MAVKAKKLLEKSVYRRTQHFIVLSKTFRDILHREYRVPLDKIYIIPGGVDIDRFNIDISLTKAREKLGWHQERPIIFCIRRLAKRMGLENLISAMALVRDRYLEGFGLIVVESLAAGTPVIETPIGGIPKILRPFSEDLVFSLNHYIRRCCAYLNHEFDLSIYA